jgi:tetratricopeptide (TPR) repeat protein
MTLDDSRPPKSVLNYTTTSVGRFYEKRHQLNGALDQYSKALSVNPDDTATYIDRSRVLLKMGSINKAQEDTGNKNRRVYLIEFVFWKIDLALNLVGDTQQNSNLLFYYVCLQKAEVLYADGEFELG